jgi:hypothetical protein
VRLDTFAYTINPKINRSVRTPSAHTYRLLVFKEHSLKTSAPFIWRFLLFASLHLQQRNEIM